jgi:predicted RNase H-like HicB family nuclease
MRKTGEMKMRADLQAVHDITQQEWDKLEYVVRLAKLSEDDGGLWHATIPLLGEGTFVGDGETKEEALADLEARRRRLLPLLLESGQPIPLPQPVEAVEDLPSGRFVIRVPRRLHAELKTAAEEEGISLNQLCHVFLDRRLSERAAEQRMQAVLDEIRQERAEVAQAAADLAVRQAISFRPRESSGAR